MATNNTSTLIRHACRTVQDNTMELTDGQLLGCFVTNRDVSAFTALVMRHSPMVWGVCQRLLAHQDAEDAFQATFLVLVRQAASIVPAEMVGNWLYGVARKTALHARRTAARRRVMEKQVHELPESDTRDQEPWDDLRPVLDEELSRLPEKYRAVIVLCDLEGRTRKEVARQLGCPEGTVGGRLARARALLAKRLTQRGVVLSSGALAGVLTQNVVSASVPVEVVSNTIRAASVFAAGQAAAGPVSGKVAALTEGVMKAMLVTKLKVATAAVFMAVALCGMTGLICRTLAGEPGTAAQPTTTPAPVVRAATADAPPDVKQGDVNEIAWGKAEAGLQAGVVFRPPGAAGEPARLVIQLRNVGREAVSVRPRPLWLSSARVRLKDGEKPLQSLAPAEIGYLSVRPRTELKAGQTVELGYAAVRIDNAETRKWVSDHPAPDYSTYFVAPGRYEASFADLLDDLPKLSTGTTSFVFGEEAKTAAPAAKPATVWGKPMNGLRAGLRSPKTVLGRGESVEVELLISNVGKYPVAFEYLAWEEPSSGVVRLAGAPERGELRLGWSSQNAKYMRTEAYLRPDDIMVRGRVTLSNGKAQAPGKRSPIELGPGTYRVSVASARDSGDRLAGPGPEKQSGADRQAGGQPPAVEWVDFPELGTGVLEVTVTEEEHVCEGDTPEDKGPATAVGGADEPRERPNVKQPDLTGRVVAVGTDGKSFTVAGVARDRQSKSVKVEVTIGEKTVVTYDGVTTGGAKPTEGYVVNVWMDDGMQKLLAARVSFGGTEGGNRWADLTGTVVEVDTDGKGIAVEVAAEGGREPKKVSVRFNERTVLAFSYVTEAKIEKNQTAWVWYDDNARVGGNRIAGQVQFYGSAFPTSHNRGPDVRGKLLSADNQTLTIEQPAASPGGEPKKMVLKLGAKTTLVYETVGPSGAKPTEGQQAAVWLENGSKDTAAGVALSGVVPERWTTLSGKVVGVSGDGATVTLEQPPASRGGNPRRIEFKRTAQTRISYSNIGPDGAKPTAGDLAVVRLLDGSNNTAAWATFERSGDRRR
jgi:RNA polymerase sigma factor (sigma-70 family)